MVVAFPLINIVVSASNLVAIVFAYQCCSFFDSCVIYLSMTASILYHLSETRHGLTGIYFLRNHSANLLLLDQVGAGICAITVLFRIFSNQSSKLAFRKQIYLIVLATVCLLLSEGDLICELLTSICTLALPHSFKSISSLQFLVFHVCWHISVFRILCSVLQRPHNIASTKVK